MGQSDAVQQAATRLDAVVNSLSKSLNEFLEDIQSVAALREQVRTLTTERDRLARTKFKTAARGSTRSGE